MLHFWIHVSCFLKERFRIAKFEILLFLKCSCNAPPSSVNSERLFSAVAVIYTEDRNRLLPDNIEMLIFLMKNIKYLKKYNYKYI